MELTTIKDGCRITAILKGELDHHSAARIRDKLDSELMDKRITELALDMGEVAFMDSSGLGVVLGRYRTLSKRGGRMIVLQTSRYVERIFRMAGIYTLVEKQGEAQNV